MKTRKLYVGNVGAAVTYEDLDRLFSQYGEVDEVIIKAENGYGFVEMSRRSEAERAKQALNGFQCKGRALIVDAAEAPKKHFSPRMKRTKSKSRNDYHKTSHLEGW